MNLRGACAIGVCTLAGAWAWACSPSEAPAPNAAPIELGTLVALTGDLSGTGVDNRDAQNLALEQINAAGGVHGRPLRFIVEDDQTTAEGARAGYTTLIGKKVPVIVGPSSSSQIASIADLIASSATTTIGRTSTSPLLSDLADGDFFFRVAPSDVFQSRVLASVVANADIDRLCLVHRDDTYGSTLADGVAARLPASIAVTRSPYNPSVQDLSFVLPKCAGLLCDPDAGAGCDESKVGLLMITFVDDGLAVLEGATRWSARKQRFFFTDGTRDTELLKRGLGDVVEGATGTHPSGPDPTLPEGVLLQAYQSSFRDRYGVVAPVFSENAYEAVYVAAAALEVAPPGAGGAEVRDAMRKTSVPGGKPVRAGQWKEIREAIAAGQPIDYQGVTGTADFDERGDLRPPYYYRVWRIAQGESITERIEKVTE